ncbi:MAG TPA: winged helix-turn-helix domain-containing protein [Dehalococcoidia bacterium]
MKRRAGRNVIQSAGIEEANATGSTSRPQISLGNLTIELAAFRVRVAQEIVYLPIREFELLTLLASNSDSVIRPEVLTQTLWQASNKRELANLRVLIHRLKQRLSQAHPYRIHTVRGRGYGLLSEV